MAFNAKVCIFRKLNFKTKNIYLSTVFNLFMNYRTVQINQLNKTDPELDSFNSFFFTTNVIDVL